MYCEKEFFRVDVRLPSVVQTPRRKAKMKNGENTTTPCKTTVRNKYRETKQQQIDVNTKPNKESFSRLALVQLWGRGKILQNFFPSP